jgi:hypothetical protein
MGSIVQTAKDKHNALRNDNDSRRLTASRGKQDEKGQSPHGEERERVLVFIAQKAAPGIHLEIARPREVPVQPTMTLKL